MALHTSEDFCGRKRNGILVMGFGIRFRGNMPNFSKRPRSHAEAESPSSVREHVSTSCKNVSLSVPHSHQIHKTFMGSTQSSLSGLRAEKHHDST